MRLNLIVLAVFLASVVAEAQVRDLASGPVTISDYREVVDHRLNLAKPIRVAKKHRPFESVALEITVDASGQVLVVEAVRGPDEFRQAAIDEAKTWTYRPFQRNGRAVPAKFNDYVRLCPPERLPSTHVPFPEIQDWNSLRMTLQRTACFGSCPAYTVEVSGDGSVVFSPVTSTWLYPVKQYSHISHEAVSEMLDVFRKVDYFSLEDEYRYAVTDNPTYVTSISFDRHTKSVVDYVGEEAGMPHDVAELELAIDRLAGTEGWIKGKDTKEKMP
jgi:Domain of unknown function (DUF6438)/Gram-negative bacterial TonB protein C-terminal